MLTIREPNKQKPYPHGNNHKRINLKAILASDSHCFSVHPLPSFSFPCFGQWVSMTQETITMFVSFSTIELNTLIKKKTLESNIIKLRVKHCPAVHYSCTSANTNHKFQISIPIVVSGWMEHCRALHFEKNNRFSLPLKQKISMRYEQTQHNINWLLSTISI